MLGTPQSGRSSTLARLAIAWAQAHPDVAVVVVPRRTSPVIDVARAHGWRVASADELARTSGARRLVVVDDAELHDDPVLAAACAAELTTVLAASRPDALRGHYQHWTTLVRRSRNGLVLGNPNEQDGDLLGYVLPRRWPVPRATGRGWLVAGGACQGIVQVALDHHPPGEHRGASTLMHDWDTVWDVSVQIVIGCRMSWWIGWTTGFGPAAPANRTELIRSLLTAALRQLDIEAERAALAQPLG